MEAFERQDCQAAMSGVKIACYRCIVAILIMTCVLLYQVYLILNCMGRAVIFNSL
jgi:hypothetical protein